jgi:hypothetical protein
MKDSVVAAIQKISDGFAALTHIKVVLIRLGIYIFVNKARGGGSAKFFINTF